MVRKAQGTHSTVVTGSNDGTKQVSKDAWNADPTLTGMQGYAAQSAEILIASGVLALTDTLTYAGAETGTSDVLDRFDNTNTQVIDKVILFPTTGDTITVTHTETPSVAGEIHLSDHTNRVLSETEPLVLYRVGTYWYEARNARIFLDSEFNVVDEADPTKKFILSLGGATTAKTLTIISSHTDNRSITIPDATDTLVGKATTDTLTNKSINLANNTITMTLAELNTAISDADAASLAGTEELTNKTITSPILTYTINAQVGTTYTPDIDDAKKIVTCDNGSAIAVTIPPNSSVAYAVGTQLNFIQKGAGQVTIGQGSGVTIGSTGATPTAPVLRAQYSAATAIKIATDTWIVVGDIA